MWFSVEVSAAKLSIQVIVFVVLGALGGDLEGHALVRQLIHPDTGETEAAPASAPPFSPVVAAAVVCPPNSQPELTKLSNAVSLSKTKITLNFFTPKPRPAWSSTTFMNVSVLLLLFTAMPSPLPDPSMKIFKPVLLNTAYPAAPWTAPWAFGSAL